MNIQKVKTKNTIFYYLNKSYRDVETGKPRSKIVEKLGSREDLEEKLGKDCDIDKWLKDYAKKRTEEDEKKVKSQTVNKQVKINKDNFVKKNLGYLFLEKIILDVKLDKICKQIEKKEKLDFDLFSLISTAIYYGILNDDNTISLSDYSKSLFKKVDIDRLNIIKSIKCVVKHSSFIQKSLYKNIQKLIKNDNKELFYTCSNYSLSSSNLEVAKYDKKSVDNTSLIKMLFDSNHIPCGLLFDCDIFNYDKQNEEVLQYLSYKFSDAKLYVLPESVETPYDKKLYQKFPDHKIIKLRSGDTLVEEDYKWATDSEGWIDSDSKKEYNLMTIKDKLLNEQLSVEERNRFTGSIFNKHKAIKEENDKGELVDKNLFFAYNYETDLWLNDFKMKQLRLFQQSVEERITNADEKLFKDAQKFGFLKVDKEDEENYNLYFRDISLLKNDSYYGFNLVCEDLDVSTLYSIMKLTYFKYNFVDFFIHDTYQTQIYNQNLSYKESIVINLLMTYLEVSIFKILDYFLNHKKYKFWDKDILKQLKDMNIIKLSKDAWAPTYKPTELTDALHKNLGFNTDFNILSDEQLKAIISGK